MPSENWRRSAGMLAISSLVRLGTDYPPPNLPVIATFSPQCIGSELGAMGATWASSTYPAANRALAVPFQIAHPFLVRKVFWMNGTTATTDSADVGVYSEAGTRLVSGGGTAISGASGTQEVDVTDTLLKPGRYWLAYSQSGVTATPIMSPFSIANARAAGAAQMATAYVLPATFTPAAIASANLPMIGIANRTVAS